MHVSRKAEEDLKEILRKVNSSGKKTLVLLCGSAGDGKSHLLSYLKNSDEEQLIQNYVVYNDATESSAPLKTAIETLNELLESYKDENLNEPGENIILAINLGVLSNFIESEYGSDFSILRNYVESSNILTTEINNNNFDEESNFQHVSFSDYHMFSLTPNGIHAGYIENILDKIFFNGEENIFYKSYINDCLACPLGMKCPVKKNFEYMMTKNCQQYVAELLVKTIIQDKVILTTREILNFIYDILIAQNFSFTRFQRLSVDDAAYLKEYMKQITPALLFDSDDVTVLMNMIKKYDPLLIRTEQADEQAISYYVSSDISQDIEQSLAGIEYKDILTEPLMITKFNNDKVLKSNLFNLMVRMDVIEKNRDEDEIYESYIKDLYMFNAGNGKKLGNLYNMVEKGVAQWCGNDDDGNFCLDDKHTGFMLFEKVEFEASLDHIPYPDDSEELQRFIPSVVTAFKDTDGGQILLDIDFSLYELIFRLNQGYIQTAEDRNNHADFISFTNRILQTGSLTEKIAIVSKSGRRANISQGMFGYKFKVVK